MSPDPEVGRHNKAPTRRKGEDRIILFILHFLSLLIRFYSHAYRCFSLQ